MEIGTIILKASENKSEASKDLYGIIF